MSQPIFNRVSLETYKQAQSERVHEEDLRSNEQYLMAAQLESREGLNAAEFHFQTARIQTEVGRTGLIGYLFNPNNEEPFLLLEGDVTGGIVTPYRENGLHVSHPETGSLGLLREGFLLAHPNIPANLGAAALHTLTARAERTEDPLPREYVDTTTAAFALQGIHLGYN